MQAYLAPESELLHGTTMLGWFFLLSPLPEASSPPEHSLQAVWRACPCGRAGSQREGRRGAGDEHGGWEEEGIREKRGPCSHMQPQSGTRAGEPEAGRGKGATLPIPEGVGLGQLWNQVLSQQRPAS